MMIYDGFVDLKYSIAWRLGMKRVAIVLLFFVFTIGVVNAGAVATPVPKAKADSKTVKVALVMVASFVKTQFRTN